MTTWSLIYAIFLMFNLKKEKVTSPISDQKFVFVLLSELAILGYAYRYIMYHMQFQDYAMAVYDGIPYMLSALFNISLFLTILQFGLLYIFNHVVFTTYSWFISRGINIKTALIFSSFIFLLSLDTITIFGMYSDHINLTLTNYQEMSFKAVYLNMLSAFYNNTAESMSVLFAVGWLSVYAYCKNTCLKGKSYV